MREPHRSGIRRTRERRSSGTRRTRERRSSIDPRINRNASTSNPNSGSISPMERRGSISRTSRSAGTHSRSSGPSTGRNRTLGVRLHTLVTAETVRMDQGDHNVEK